MKTTTVLLVAAIVLAGCKTVPVWTTETQPDPTNPGSVVEVEVPVMDDMGTPDDPTDDVQETRSVPDEDLITTMAGMVLGPAGASAATGVFAIAALIFGRKWSNRNG